MLCERDVMMAMATLDSFRFKQEPLLLIFVSLSSYLIETSRYTTVFSKKLRVDERIEVIYYSTYETSYLL